MAIARAQSYPPLISRVRAGDAVVVRLMIPPDIAEAFPGRSVTAGRVFRRVMRQQGGVSCGDGDAANAYRVERKSLAQLQHVWDRLKRTTTNIVYAPLGPKTLEDVLEISSAERARWTNDGRLAVMDKSVASRGGSSFAVPLFCAQMIAELRCQPEIIASWRDMDRSADPCGRASGA